MAKSYDISYHCETDNKNIRITATPLRNNSQTQRICNMSESYCQYKHSCRFSNGVQVAPEQQFTPELKER